jgi:hypothetical protein
LLPGAETNFFVMRVCVWLWQANQTAPRLVR